MIKKLIGSAFRRDKETPEKKDKEIGITNQQSDYALYKEKEYLKKLEQSIVEDKAPLYIEPTISTPVPMTAQESSTEDTREDIVNNSFELPKNEVSKREFVFDKEESLVENEPPQAPKKEIVDQDQIIPGTIMQLEDGTIAVYKEPIKDKEYELVYVLLPNGKVAPQGIVLYAYSIRVLGKIPEQILNKMFFKLRWTRDEITFHLDTFDYVQLIPHINPSAHLRTKTEITTTPIKKPATSSSSSHIPTAHERKKLVKGRKIEVMIGDKKWEAVYWAKDQIGDIVAHNTHKEWALMHLDLSRFNGSLVMGDLLSPEAIDKIQKILAKNQ